LSVWSSKIFSILFSVNAAFSIFQSRAELKKVSLIFRPIGNQHSVRVDGEIISRVVANLLSNALRHSQEGGMIEGELSFEKDQRSVLLTVKDSGRGIPPEYHEKIFNKFEQLELTKSDVCKGAGGLGLAFCKMAIEAHGGKIWVESQGNGNGSTFCVKIPAE